MTNKTDYDRVETLKGMARDKGEQWNWNYNKAEVALDLIQEGITDADDLEIFGEEFCRYFEKTKDVETQWSDICEIIETFSYYV